MKKSLKYKKLKKKLQASKFYILGGFQSLLKTYCSNTRLPLSLTSYDYDVVFPIDALCLLQEAYSIRSTHTGAVYCFRYQATRLVLFGAFRIGTWRNSVQTLIFDKMTSFLLNCRALELYIGCNNRIQSMEPTTQLVAHWSS